MTMNDKDKMHPEDIRNLVIFAFLSIAIWFAYENFVLKPQAEAMRSAQQARAEMIERTPELLNPVVVVDRAQALEESAPARLSFENGALKGSISLKGGAFDDLSFRNYHTTLEKTENVVLFSPRQVKGSRYVDYGWVSRDTNLKLPNKDTVWNVIGGRRLTPESPVTLFWDNGQGVRFKREISIDDDYLFSITQRVENKSAAALELYPYGLISQNGIPEDYARTWVSYEGPTGYIDATLEAHGYKDVAKKGEQKIESKRGWIGVSDKYWLSALMPAQDRATKYRFKHVADPVEQMRDRYQSDYTGGVLVVPAGAEASYPSHLYAGAKKILMLKKYQKEIGVDRLDLAVDFGWFWFFTYPFFLALHYLGLLVGNMGVAIILLTAVLRMAVFPLTNISYRSFAKMKVVGPQINDLRDQHGDDKAALQEAIVKLYQKEGVNPMSGCLPILVQIPIFFAFYKILFSTIEIRHAPFFGWIEDLSAKDPTSIFNLFGLLPWSVPEFLMIGAWPCMMLVAMLIQKRLNPPPQDKLQRDMMNIFPFFITFIMAKFASGLVIYWTFSALFSVMQQAFIMRSMGVPIYLFEKSKIEEEMEEKVDQGPDVHPLVEMAEDEVEEALFGDEEGAVKPVKDIKPPKPKKKKKKK